MALILLGIDAGGTKTEGHGWCLETGLHHRVVGPPSNYQGVGMEAASAVWRDIISDCLVELDADSPDDIAAAGLGIAGLDRPKDEALIDSVFSSLLPAASYELVNDAYLALRGGTPDGIGVAVVSGTGCNAMGTNAGGDRFRVGGIGPEFGDLGSASDIGQEALRAAFRSQDDRGPHTLITTLLMERLGLERLDDMVDYFLFDYAAEVEDGFQLELGLLAPLVFEAALKDDAVAIGILEWAGKELGLSARAVARNLFARNDEFPVILGGSVLQKGASPHLRMALDADLRSEFPNVRMSILQQPPVFGALRYAIDRYAATGDAGPQPLFEQLDSRFRSDG